MWVLADTMQTQHSNNTLGDTHRFRRYSCNCWTRDRVLEYTLLHFGLFLVRTHTFHWSTVRRGEGIAPDNSGCFDCKRKKQGTPGRIPRWENSQEYTGTSLRSRFDLRDKLSCIIVYLDRMFDLGDTLCIALWFYWSPPCTGSNWRSIPH